MKVFISGISGTAMGPLALMVLDAGIEVCGTDLSEGAITPELVARGIEFKTGPSAQDGKYFQSVAETVDWFVYTSALPENHPELTLAKKLGIRTSKRDELIAYLIEKLGLSLVAIAGTHGKTTTTSLIIWACLELDIPISYLVGTTLPFAESGRYDSSSRFLIYEADEYDRNFLHFSPWLTAITTITYDHPDIYKSPTDYKKAFLKFISQSENVVNGDEAESLASEFSLAGEARRYDAALALLAIEQILDEIDMDVSRETIIEILDKFPGAGRRFERIADGVYTDYGHHPEEIAATITVAREEAENIGAKGVVVVYEPHQNVRQTEVFDGYHDVFTEADKLFWLPTYLTREDPKLKIIMPEEFIESLDNAEIGIVAKPDKELADTLWKLREDGYLILLMTAGPADKWLRKAFGGKK